MRPARILMDYFNHLQALVYSSRHVSRQPRLGFRPDRRHGAARALLSAEHIEFADGAVLGVDETLEVTEDGQIVRPRYRYHYEVPSAAFFFRYDRDLKSAKVHVHEECHLHVMQETPRYKTHAASFEEVFRFIEASFYHGT